MKQLAQPTAKITGYRLEMKDALTGEIVKVITANQETGRIIAKYSDGHEEDLGAFNDSSSSNG